MCQYLDVEYRRCEVYLQCLLLDRVVDIRNEYNPFHAHSCSRSRRVVSQWEPQAQAAKEPRAEGNPTHAQGTGTTRRCTCPGPGARDRAPPWLSMIRQAPFTARCVFAVLRRNWTADLGSSGVAYLASLRRWGGPARDLPPNPGAV